VVNFALRYIADLDIPIKRYLQWSIVIDDCCDNHFVTQGNIY
jgi:hypothetical protein